MTRIGDLNRVFQQNFFSEVKSEKPSEYDVDCDVREIGDEKRQDNTVVSECPCPSDNCTQGWTCGGGCTVCSEC